MGTVTDAAASAANTVRDTLFGRQTNKEDTVNNRDELGHPQRSTNGSALNGDSLSSDTRYDETSDGKYQLNNPSSTMKHSGTTPRATTIDDLMINGNTGQGSELSGASDTQGYSGDPPSYDTGASFGGDRRSDYNKDTPASSLSGVTSGLDDSFASQHDNQTCDLDSGATSNPSKRDRTDILPGSPGSTVDDTRSTGAFDPSNQFENRDRSTGEYDSPSTSGFSSQQAISSDNAAETDDLSSDLSSDKRSSEPADDASQQNFGDSYSQGIPDTGLGDESRENKIMSSSNALEGEFDNTNASDPTSSAPTAHVSTSGAMGNDPAGAIGPSVGAGPSPGATPGQKQRGADGEPPTDYAAGQDGTGRKGSVSLVEGHLESQNIEAVDGELPSLPGSEEGTGTQYVKSSGLAAEGGGFDAAAPGAGREADRLREEVCVDTGEEHAEGHGSSHGHRLLGGHGHDSPGNDSGKPSLGEKIKSKLPGHH